MPLLRAILKSDFRQDIFSTTISRLICIGLGFLSSVILARLLGPEGRGIFAAIVVVPNLIAVIANTGLRQSAVYHIGRQIFSVDDVIGTLMFLLIPLSLLGMTVAMGVFLVQDLIIYGTTAIIFALLRIPAAILKAYMTGVGMGLRMIRKINYSEIIFASMYLILIVALVWGVRIGVDGALVALVFSTLIQALILLAGFNTEYSIKCRYIKGVPLKLISKGIVYAFSLFLLQFIYRLDILFLTHFVSKEELGYFVVAVSLMDVIRNIPHILGFVIFSHSSSSKDHDGFTRKNWQLLKLMTPISAGFGVLLCIMAPFLVPMVYGHAYIPIINIIWYLLIGEVAMVPNHIMRSDISGRGRPELLIYISSVIFSIKFVLNLLIIPRYGTIGASISCSASYLLYMIILYIVYKKKFLKGSTKPVDETI